jgi:hypothetical protein
MTDDQFNVLCECISSIAKGDRDSPGGLEGVTMALGGEGVPGNKNIADALFAIAESINNLSTTIELKYLGN